MSEIDAAVVTLDRQDRVLDANERARELFDWGSEYVGVSAGEFFESVPDEVLSQFTGRGDTTTDLSLTIDGQQLHFWVSVSPVGDRTEQGRVVLLHDITAQKRREEELEELNTRFELTLDETDTGIWDWDLETDDIHWDEATERLFGYEPGEFPGTFEAIAEHVHDDDIPAVRSAIDRSLETGEEYQAEFRVEPPDGGQRWVQTRGIVETDGSGTPTRMLGIQTDITERKEREIDLAAARESAETIIEASPAPIWVQGIEEIHYANNAAAALFGFDDPETLEGSSAMAFVPEEQRERALERNRKMLDGDDRLPEMAGTLVTVDGETREALFAAAPIQYHGDRSIVTIANDITERRTYERQLEEQRNNLEILNQVVRHDIRNELQVVLGHLEKLQGTVSEAGEEGVTQALGATSNAIDITTTAREVTEVMLQSNVERQPVRLRSVLRTELGSVRSNHDQARVKLDNSCPDVEVVADDMLASVFRNLLTNAIQHNDAEVPEVTVRVSKDDGTAVVRVADNGPGIPDDRKQEIFEQGEMGLDSEGTGLGLYLVDTLVSGYGGQVRVEDGPAGGAIFVVELPLAESV